MSKVSTKFNMLQEHLMEQKMALGRSTLQVPRLGVGAMTWGDAKGLARLHPAKTAYGGGHGFDEDKLALESRIAARVPLFATAAMYSGGADALPLGALVHAQNVLVSSRLPGGFS